MTLSDERGETFYGSSTKWQEGAYYRFNLGHWFRYSKSFS